MLHAQRREAKRQPDSKARNRGHGQHDEERHTRLEADCTDVRSDTEEGGLAERHLSGVADRQIEPERRHQVDAEQRQQIDIAALRERRQHGDGDERRDENAGFELCVHTSTPTLAAS